MEGSLSGLIIIPAQNNISISSVVCLGRHDVRISGKQSQMARVNAHLALVCDYIHQIILTFKNSYTGILGPWLAIGASFSVQRTSRTDLFRTWLL